MEWKDRETNVALKQRLLRKVGVTFMLTALVVLCGALVAKSLGATSRPVTSAEISRGARDARRQYGQWYYMWNPSVRQSGSTRTIRISSPGTLTSYGGGSVRYSSGR